MGRSASRFSLTSFGPWHLFLIVALLAAYGLLVVWSAVQTDPDYEFTRQLTGVLVGLVFMLAISQFDFRRLTKLWGLWLGISLLLILSPHFPGIGVTVNGASSWIELFGYQMQPSEFAKVTVVLFTASLVAHNAESMSSLKTYLKVLALLLLPFVAILTQPDIGTGMVYLVIAAAALIMGGARSKHLLITLGAGVLLIGAAFAVDEFLKYETANGYTEYVIIKSYQRARLAVFLNPDADLIGDGYNLEQAKIAIGSGGLFGKGLLNATQSANGFLPEACTDFIFCVLCEELGFFGAFLLIALYIGLWVFCVNIARHSTSMFGLLLGMSIVGMWVFMVVENIGMTMGMLPVTGIPLPFVSYGSSFMLVNFVMIGIIASVWKFG
ncbi:MAG: rod shape-determining protein RodA, partial [Eggerthellaceae bacterium]|nr:rod shape-determining protein RodA [Eggerthellaceae bacterium]